MNQKQREARAAGVNLSQDVADSDGGITKYRNLKRTDKVCPRCHQKAVSRPLRKCEACGGRLLWNGDSTELFDEKFEHYFMWFTSIFGLTGWYDADYFKGGFNKSKY